MGVVQRKQQSRLRGQSSKQRKQRMVSITGDTVGEEWEFFAQKR